MRKVIYLIIFCFLFACGDDDDPIDEAPLSPDEIFPNSIKIDVPPFQYNDSLGNMILVKGDAASFSDPDTVPGKPAFSWVSTKQKLVTVAIFSERIIVRNDKIVNEEDIVWIWNSGLEKGREGSVKFNDGKNVVNGQIDFSQIPSPLASERYYIWGIWAWDDSGIKISHSSKELAFYVR